jgi:glutamate synthase domain-containing protein 3
VRRTLIVSALAAGLGLICAGCGSSGATTPAGLTTPVAGKVTYRGKPLTGGTVVFEPDSAGREAYGSIQPDGSFTLTTYQSGDGAVRGLHRVAVQGAVPVKYRHTSSSTVEVEVVEGTREYTIALD